MNDDTTTDDMDVDTAALDADEQLIEQLRSRIITLEREVAHLQNLRENAYRTIQNLDAQIREPKFSGKELYATTATGKTWHSRSDCHHLRGTRFKGMKPCSDCACAG